MAHPPNTPAEAVAWCDRQVRARADWTGRCETAVRTSYGLGPVYPDANAHFADVPASHRHGTSTPPPAGAIALGRDHSHGHSMICSGRGWEAFSSSGPGWSHQMRRISDLRRIWTWMGALDWYVSDPWFRGLSWQLDWSARPCPGTIAPDARGSAVRAWQAEMIEHHWMSDVPGNRDGWYGPGMERKAREMQRALSVPVDAILGPVTWQALA